MPLGGFASAFLLPDIHRWPVHYLAREAAGEFAETGVDLQENRDTFLALSDIILGWDRASVETASRMAATAGAAHGIPFTFEPHN